MAFPAPWRAVAHTIVRPTTGLALLLLLTAALAGCADDRPEPETDTPEVQPGRTVAVGLENGTVLRLDLPAGGGLIVGSVTDEAGEPLAGIHVSLLGTDHVEVTPESGHFVFQNLAAGDYGLRADAKGYRAAEATVAVLPDVITRVGVTMLELKASDASSSLAEPQSRNWLTDQSTIPGTPIVLLPLWILLAAAVLLAGVAATFGVRSFLLRPARLVERGRQALLEGESQAAERYARRALHRDEGFSDAWFLLGASLIHRGAFEEAVTELERASARYDPRVAGFAFLITIAHHRMGRPEAARRWLPVVARDQEYWDALDHDPETAFRTWLVRGKPKRPEDPAYA